MHKFVGLTALSGSFIITALGTSQGAVLGQSPWAPSQFETVNVQPIDVCSNTGTNCASVGNLPSWESMANLIWQQAGIDFNFLSPVTLDNSAYLNPTATGSVWDGVHLLIRSPGDGQNSNPNTINAWLTGNFATAGVYGYGLINSNGVVIPANGHVDTLAHELGHNLGLTHVDDPPLSTTNLNTPYYLMNGRTRSIPTNGCQVFPYSCGGSPQPGRDELASTMPTPLPNPPQGILQTEIDTARDLDYQHAFVTTKLTVPGTQTTCGPTNHSCALQLGVVGLPMDNNYLVETLIRFLSRTDITVDHVALSGVTCIPSSTSISTSGGNEELDLFWSGAVATCLDVGASSGVILDYGSGYTAAFSVQFNFDKGTFTSTAGWDQTAVPEPASLTYIGLGVAALLVRKPQRRLAEKFRLS